MIDAAAIWARPWACPPVTGGQIRLEGGLIAAIEQAPASGDLLLVPGLINAHDHGRGLAPLTYGAADAPLEAWLWDLRRAPATDVYLSHLVAFGEMALSGVTTVVHNHLPQSTDLLAEAHEVARAAHDIGIRLALVLPVIDQNLAGYDGGAAALAPLSPSARAAVESSNSLPPVAEQINMVEQIAAAVDDGIIITQYGPPGPQWLSLQGWEMVGEAAQKSGRKIHTHLLETRPQREWLDTIEPRGAAAFFASANLLTEQLTVAHGVHLTPSELADLARAGVTLALNSSSNLRLRSGQINGADLSHSQITLGLGLDGMGFDDDADIWRELRLTLRLLGPEGFSNAGLAQSALLNAVFASGRRAYDGRVADGLVVGAEADLVGLSLSQIAADQIDMSLTTTAALVLGRANRSAVRRVIVGGREIVRDGHLQGVDLPAARQELIAQARHAFASAHVEDWIATARAATRHKYGGAS
ncbi:amidohydrolase family protein [Pararhodobacter oceanensis]|uniref:amidohydrolase family protein n=1 Tax=Pararhodobacter oceanensis TaxID=2172121 RepID=UPI003A8E4D05